MTMTTKNHRENKSNNRKWFYALFIQILILCNFSVDGFLMIDKIPTVIIRTKKITSTCRHESYSDDGDYENSSNNNNERKQNRNTIKSSDESILSLEERAIRYTILQKLFANNSDGDNRNDFVELRLLGQGYLPFQKKEQLYPCLFLSHSSSSSFGGNNNVAMPLPLSQPNTSQLLTRVNNKKGVGGKYSIIRRMPLLTNRDGALYDNLPWSSWTIDPYKCDTVDAAGNPILEKYTLGKRVAYQRLYGKDWYSFVGKRNNNNNNNNVLLRRISELALREARMDLAQAERELAMIKQNNINGNSDTNLYDDATNDELKEAMEAVKLTQDIVNDRFNSWESKFGKKSSNINNSFLKKGSNVASPYRGAIGYRDISSLDNDSTLERSYKCTYRNPYDIMLEIIQDQLNADVILAVLENTSFFDGVELKGALVLQRRGRKKQLNFGGESIELDDSDDDFGNLGVTKGSLLIVDCDSDEAIGMAQSSSNIPIHIDETLYQTLQMPIQNNNDGNIPFNINDDANGTTLPTITVRDTDGVLLQRWGDGRPSQGTKVLIPRSSSSRPSSFPLLSSQASSMINKPVFNTENPIKSLDQYDALSNRDKVQLLLSLESFQSNLLPRPRALLRSNISKSKTTSNGDSNTYAKNSDQQTNDEMDALDELLIPFIDESVRRQFLTRQAKSDLEREQLIDGKSKRQVMLEKAEDAEDESTSQMYKEYADFLETLRADVTQDIGTYSSYLDKDEWYERDRLARVEQLKAKKKKIFGTLLDGIE